VVKKWKAVLAVTAIASTVLAGCSSGSSDPDGSSDTLTVWTFKKEWVPGLEAAAKAYAEKTGTDFKLDIQYFNEENGIYASKVAAAARSKTLPDLLTAYGSSWDYVGGGLYQKLNGKMDDVLGNIPTALVDDFVKLNQATATTCADNPDCTYADVKVGDYYTVPQISGATGYFFANKAKLKEAGVDPDTAPADWAELISEMEKTKAALGKTGGFAMPLKIPETGWLWLLRPALFTQLGAEKLDALFADKSGAMWEDPAVVKTLENYDELSPYWIDSALQNDIIMTDDAFAAGQATWYFGGTFSLAGLVQKGVDPADLLVFPMPTAAGAEASQLKLRPWASGQIGISSSTKKTEAATEFLKFYMSKPAAEAFQEAVHDTPAVALPADDAAASNPLVAATDVSFGDGPDAYNEVKAYGPQCDAAKTLNNQAAVALTQLIGGKTTPDALAAKLHDLYKKAWASCAS